MDLKERMQRSNKNNSGILNNSDFNFEKNEDKIIKSIVDDQIYNKARRECGDQLTKRKNDLLEIRRSIDAQRKKSFEDMMRKFQIDYEEIKRQILHNIEASLNQNKAKIINQIKQRRFGETADEIQVKKDIDELLNKINFNLEGLKRDDKYRDYIAQVVTTDFDSPREEIKVNARKIKYLPVVPSIDEKYYNCIKNDSHRVIGVDFNVRRENQGPNVKSNFEELNTHMNRDNLKKNIF